MDDPYLAKTLEARITADPQLARTLVDHPRQTIEPPRPPSSGAMAALTALRALGASVGGRIDLHDTLGEGGMGVVHLATQATLGRHVAVKTLKPGVTSPEAALRILREAWVTGALEHPNVVPVHDVGVDAEGAPVIVMKRIEGRSWADLMRDPDEIARRFGVTDPLEWNLRTLASVCNAAHFAHSRGILHRDLKPDNVMIGEFGEVYVLDWGIARVLERSELRVSRDSRGKLDEPGNLVGTYVYMSPEQASGRTDEVDERTDVFALGAMLYYVLTGRPPYQGGSAQEIIQAAREVRFRPPQEVVAALPPALCAIAVKAMSAAPGDRYSSVALLRDQVEHSMRSGLALARVSFPAGAIIVREGDPPDAAYIVTRGCCEAFRGSGAERSVLRQMGPGDVFGELALLSSRPRSASVAAVEDLEALVVTREVFEREVHADSWVVSLLRTLVSRFRELEQELEGARR